MFGNVLLAGSLKSVLREMGVRVVGQLVVIVAFVMPLDALEFRDLAWVSGDLWWPCELF